jgi:hypothetical protein
MPKYSREKMRDYMRVYRQERLDWALDLLGRRCVVCGATERLQFDHVDPATKTKPVTTMLHASRMAFESEVKKCQLLCHEHHKTKSNAERRQRPARPIVVRHGTAWAYNEHGCRCEPCKEAKRAARRNTVGCSGTGIAPVPKTGAVTGMGVRISPLPPSTPL